MYVCERLCVVGAGGGGGLNMRAAMFSKFVCF